MTNPKTLYPARLQKGDTIGVIAPSSVFEVTKLNNAIEILKNAGYKVKLHPQTEYKYGQFAGTDDEKVAALHDYFVDPQINAIFCTSGGNGALHLLDKIDFALIKSNPKIFMGFSDITILLNAITTKTGLVTFHGPTLTKIQALNDSYVQSMLGVLGGTITSINVNTTEETNGTLWGGNLSAFQALIGTGSMPNMSNGLLLLEDINDHLSRYDRMIGHLKQSGALNGLNAVIKGDFTNSLDNKDRPFGFTEDQIIKRHINEKTKIITNAPFGHDDRLATLPIGANASLKNGQLSFKAFKNNF